MKRLGVVQTVLTWPAIVGICSANAVWAGAASSKPTVADVALAEGGVLLGLVADAQGAPLAKARVALWERDRQIGTTVTNDRGYFTFRALRGGVYQIITVDNHGIYRLWAPGTAPPTARQEAVIVAGQEIVRGQAAGGGAAAATATNTALAGIATATATLPVLVALTQEEIPVSP